MSNFKHLISNFQPTPAQPQKISLNFTRESEFEKSYLGKVLYWVTSTGKHVIIIVNFILIAAFISRFYFDRVLSDLNDSIKVKEEIIKANAPFEKQFREIQKKLEDVKTLTQDNNRPYEILQEIVSLAPPGTKFNNLSLDKQMLTFSASLPSKETMQLFIRNLNSSPLFSSVEIGSASKQNLKDQNIISSFQIQII